MARFGIAMQQNDSRIAGACGQVVQSDAVDIGEQAFALSG
jgi:hypothetical protein